MNSPDKTSIRTFTIGEKLYAQITFIAGTVVSAYGLFLRHTGLGIAYLLYAYIGILLVVRYTICPRCPHLLIANDCVQLPAPIMKTIICSKRRGPLNRHEKILFIAVLYGIFILPLYWLASQPLVFILFIALYGGHLAGLWLHFCAYCRNAGCIQKKIRDRFTQGSFGSPFDQHPE